MIVTRSNPSAFPSALRQKKTSLVQQRNVEKKKVYVDEECEKCGNDKMSVKTMQLRSADEDKSMLSGLRGRRLRTAGCSATMAACSIRLARADMRSSDLFVTARATVFYDCDRCGHSKRLNN